MQNLFLSHPVFQPGPTPFPLLFPFSFLLPPLGPRCPGPFHVPAQPRSPSPLPSSPADRWGLPVGVFFPDGKDPDSPGVRPRHDRRGCLGPHAKGLAPPPINSAPQTPLNPIEEPQPPFPLAEPYFPRVAAIVGFGARSRCCAVAPPFPRLVRAIPELCVEVGELADPSSPSLLLCFGWACSPAPPLGHAPPRSLSARLGPARKP